MNTRTFLSMALACTLAGLVLVVSCAVNPVTGKRDFMLLTEADEIQLGKQTDHEVVATYGVLEKPELQAYVEDLGRRLARVSHRPHLPYSFKVLDSPVINAFAVPGGFIYLTRGILAYLNDEAELAGVMGHEIGHVTARHTAKQYSKAMLAGLGLEIGKGLSTEFRKYAPYVEFGVSMLFLKFSRDDERQADELGVTYSTKAGYDATHMANLFVTLERLQPSSAQGLPDWFSTHPNPPSRIQNIRKLAAQWQKTVAAPQYSVNSEQYLRTIDGIVFGEDPRQGYVADGVFYHPTMRFQFPVPANWHVENAPSQVQMVSPQEDAVMLFMLSQEQTPQEAAEKFVQQTGASVVESTGLQVNGLPAHRLVTNLVSQQTALSVMSYFIKKDNIVFVFHGYTLQAGFAQYRSVFQGTMSQFRQLTDPARINVKPAVLRVRQAPREASLRELLKGFGVTDDSLPAMAVLNGRTLEEVVPAGTLIKVVEK
ncbi:MAG: M48 family metalloprotease [candidate division KSB1 bacterium]|nr:M48 family metalloprotease [candidate division KSB1 bacterium]